jgi:DNA-binding transcriptional LysR family regulator
MDSKQLQHIVEITKHSSLPIAAWNLHLAPFTISQPITSLEKELRLKFFNRSQAYGAVPTGEDRIILI